MRLCSVSLPVPTVVPLVEHGDFQMVIVLVGPPVPTCILVEGTESFSCTERVMLWDPLESTHV